MTAPDEYAGRMAKCKACGQPAPIPDVSIPSPPKQVVVPTSVAPPPAPVPPAAPPSRPAPVVDDIDHWGVVSECLGCAAGAAGLAGVIFLPAAIAGFILSAGAIPAAARARSLVHCLAGVLICVLIFLWCGLLLMVNAADLVTRQQKMRSAMEQLERP